MQKWQSVNTLTIFIGSNQGDEDTTQVSKIVVSGTTVHACAGHERVRHPEGRRGLTALDSLGLARSRAASLEVRGGMKYGVGLAREGCQQQRADQTGSQ